MAIRLKQVDAVMVGMGWTGSIMARELTKAGLEVVGLERGEDLTSASFAAPQIRDELKYGQRLELVQDPAPETLTFRNRRSEHALPMRRMGSFLPGSGTGGSSNLWGGLLFRYLPVVHRRARALAPDDVLTRLLTDLLRQWPLSGVLADVADEPTTPLQLNDHPGLLLLYAERLLHNDRPAWRPTTGLARETWELVRASHDAKAEKRRERGYGRSVESGSG